MYYEYSYNLVHLLQSKERIHRLGLPAEQYAQYYYMGLNYEVEGDAWSIDRQVYDRLEEKEQTMQDAIDNNFANRKPLIFHKKFQTYWVSTVANSYTTAPLYILQR